MSNSAIHSKQANTLSYLRLIALQGAKSQFLLGLVSRIPVGTTGAAIIVSVSHSLGNYTDAGIAAALYSLFAAFAMPSWARLMDRRGQAFVLPRVATLQAFSLIILTLLCFFIPNAGAVWICCALVGATSVDAGSMVRARWLARLDTEPAKKTAFMLESVADELVFALAPAATMLVAAIEPLIAPLVVVIGPILGWIGLSTSAVKQVNTSSSFFENGKWLPDVGGVFLFVFLTFMCVGTLFGIVEVQLIAYANNIQKPAFAGATLAAWAFGSGAVAMLFGPRLSKFDSRKLVVFGTLIMTVFTVLLSVSLEPNWQLACCFLAGIGAAPAISGGFSFVSNITAPKNVTQSMALLSTALSFGTVAGASSGGFIADHFSLEFGFIAASSVGVVALVFAAVTCLPLSWVKKPRQSRSI